MRVHFIWNIPVNALILYYLHFSLLSTLSLISDVSPRFLRCTRIVACYTVFQNVS